MVPAWSNHETVSQSGDNERPELSSDAPAPDESAARAPLSEEEQRYRDVLSFLGPDVRSPVGVPREYRPQEHSIHPLFRIDIGDYGGPLDLLVYLIRKHEVDVFDIPIKFLTERYLEMLEVLRALDIDVAAEFLVLAADLTHIKSKMLLPAKEGEPVDDEPEDVGDPRADLVRRLLEYQKYRDAAEELGDRDQLGRDVFARQPPLLDDDEQLDPGLKQVSIFKLVELMAGMIKKKPVRHEISYESFNIAERMHFVLRFGTSQGGRFALVDLMEQVASRAELVVTFIAVLESTKLQLVRLRVEDTHSRAPSPFVAREADPSALAEKVELPKAAAEAEPDDGRPAVAEANSARAEAAVDAPSAASVEAPSPSAPEAAASEALEADEAASDAPEVAVGAEPAPAGPVDDAKAAQGTPDASMPMSAAETEALIQEVAAIEREMAQQKEEEEALQARRAAASPAETVRWADEPLPSIWVELTGKQFEGDIMDDYA